MLELQAPKFSPPDPSLADISALQQKPTTYHSPRSQLCLRPPICKLAPWRPELLLDLSFAGPIIDFEAVSCKLKHFACALPSGKDFRKGLWQQVGTGGSYCMLACTA